MASTYEHLLEDELEGELGEIGELEDELGEIGELEDELGEIGEFEDELGEIGELEDELGEFGEFEDELGEVGELEDELGEIGEFEDELGEFGEFEQGEQFFGKLKKIARGVGRFVKKNAPLLKKIAKVAAPMIGTAIGGPLGGKLASAATRLLGEHELGELESGEFELGEHEAAPETLQELHGELMAAAASQAASELEAQAMAGAAAVASITPRDARSLRNVLPHLVRGTSILTRILRRSRRVRPALRAMPTIVRRTRRILARRAAAGQPVTRRLAGRVMASQVQRVLGRPRSCAKAMISNVRGARTARRAGASVRRRAR